MKTLVVYAKESVYKYPKVYEDFVFSVSPEGTLVVYETKSSQSMEEKVAVFRNWDYCLVEKEWED